MVNGQQRAHEAANSENCRRSSTTQASSWVETVDAQKLVDQNTEHSQHSSAAVVALSVQLEGLGLLIIVTDPAFSSNVTRCLVVGLAIVQEVPSLHHAGGDHDLEPSSAWKC